MKFVLLSSALLLALGSMACQNAGVQSGDLPREDQYGASGSFLPTKTYSAEEQDSPLFKNYYMEGCTQPAVNSSIATYDHKVAVSQVFERIQRKLTSIVTQTVVGYKSQLVIDESKGNHWHGKGTIVSTSLSTLAADSSFETQCTDNGASERKNVLGETKTTPSVSCGESTFTESVSTSSVGSTETHSRSTGGSLPDISSVAGPSCSSSARENEWNSPYAGHFKYIVQDGKYSFANGRVVLARRVVSIASDVPLSCDGDDVGRGTHIVVRITSYEVPSLNGYYCGGTEIFSRTYSTGDKGKLLSDTTKELTAVAL
jgi:hypothetical protein